jgi:hypothetical protein
MGTIYKILGQVNPAATTNTTVYTAPAGANTVISTISICNLGTSNTTYRIAIIPAGKTQVANSYIAYDTGLPASDAIALTLGLTLSAGDVCNVYSISNNVSFNLYGSEIT